MRTEKVGWRGEAGEDRAQILYLPFSVRRLRSWIQSSNDSMCHWQILSKAKTFHCVDFNFRTRQNRRISSLNVFSSRGSINSTILKTAFPSALYFKEQLLRKHPRVQCEKNRGKKRDSILGCSNECLHKETSLGHRTEISKNATTCRMLLSSRITVFIKKFVYLT